MPVIDQFYDYFVYDESRFTGIFFYIYYKLKAPILICSSSSSSSVISSSSSTTTTSSSCESLHEMLHVKVIFSA